MNPTQPLDRSASKDRDFLTLEELSFVGFSGLRSVHWFEGAGGAKSPTQQTHSPFHYGLELWREIRQLGKLDQYITAQIWDRC